MKRVYLVRALQFVALALACTISGLFVGKIAGAFVGMFGLIVLLRLDLRLAFVPGILLLMGAAVAYAAGQGQRADVLASYSFAFIATGTVAGIVTSGREASECES